MSYLNVPRYIVNLSKKDVENRLDVFFQDKCALNAAKKLILAAFNDTEKQAGPFLTKVTSKLTNALFKMIGTGECGYAEEISAWSKYTGIEIEKVVTANLSYELYQSWTWLLKMDPRKTFRKLIPQFCSSVSFYQTGIGMVHARNMDWPLDGLRDKTVLIKYKNGSCGDFTAVSAPAMVGVLSGVAKGRFSATINQAPASLKMFPNLISGWSAMFLLRWIFENCESYDDAFRVLEKATTIVPVFIQLVGTKRGQACVFEVNPTGKNFYYEYDGGPLAITNHNLDDEEYEDKEWQENGVDYHTDSLERLEMITEKASKCKAKTLEQCLSVIRGYPVMGSNTQQSMVMCAKTGGVILQ